MFAFETRRIVSRSKIDNVVDDIVKLLEYAKGFPQEHLMSAGQLSLNRHITHNPGIEPSLGGLSATLPLRDYVRVVRDSPKISGSATELPFPQWSGRFGCFSE